MVGVSSTSGWAVINSWSQIIMRGVVSIVNALGFPNYHRLAHILHFHFETRVLIEHLQCGKFKKKNKTNMCGCGWVSSKSCALAVAPPSNPDRPYRLVDPMRGSAHCLTAMLGADRERTLPASETRTPVLIIAGVLPVALLLRPSTSSTAAYKINHIFKRKSNENVPTFLLHLPPFLPLVDAVGAAAAVGSVVGGAAAFEDAASCKGNYYY